MRHTAYKGEGDESGGSSGAWGFARESAMSASAITLRVSIAFRVAWVLGPYISFFSELRTTVRQSSFGWIKSSSPLMLKTEHNIEPSASIRSMSRSAPQSRWRAKPALMRFSVTARKAKPLVSSSSWSAAVLWCASSIVTRVAVRCMASAAMTNFRV